MLLAANALAVPAVPLKLPSSIGHMKHPVQAHRTREQHVQQQASNAAVQRQSIQLEKSSHGLSISSGKRAALDAKNMQKQCVKQPVHLCKHGEQI